MSTSDTVEVLVTFVKVNTSTLVVELVDFEASIPRSEVQYDGLLDHCVRGEVIEIRVPEAVAVSRGLL